MSSIKKRALLFHLDLGIGGAERLLISIAQALADNNWDVTVATTRFDPNRCFPECRDKRLRILQSGGWIPRNAAFLFTAIFSIVRLLWLYLYILVVARHDAKYDVVVSDQLAMFNPLLKCLGKKLVFYCHFPDPLMASHDKPLSSIYRRSIDAVEAHGMRYADAIWVNSSFTREKFESVFNKRLLSPVEIVYPCVVKDTEDQASLPSGLLSKKFFLSLNRFETKKKHELAIEAFVDFCKTDAEVDIKLVVCGGYDSTLQENQDCYQRLKEAARSVEERVLFVRSAPDGVRSALLRDAIAVLYTPSDEHFGIVPIESMSYGTPVIAVNSGGPKESILDGKTGTLTDPKPSSFSQAMQTWKSCAGAQHVREECVSRASQFSYEKFASEVMRRIEA